MNFVDLRATTVTNALRLSEQRDQSAILSVTANQIDDKDNLLSSTTFNSLNSLESTLKTSTWYHNNANRVVVKGKNTLGEWIGCGIAL